MFRYINEEASEDAVQNTTNDDNQEFVTEHTSDISREETEEQVEENPAMAIDTTGAMQCSVLLDAKDMYRFMMRHTYRNIAGIFSVLLSLGALVLLAVNINKYESFQLVLLALVGLTFTVIQPIQLKFRSKKQIKNQAMFAEPLVYYFVEEGIVITQGEQRVLVRWNEIRKVEKSKYATYVYLSTVRAFIFPEDKCGEIYQEVVRTMDEEVRKARVGGK